MAMLPALPQSLIDEIAELDSFLDEQQSDLDARRNICQKLRTAGLADGKRVLPRGMAVRAFCHHVRQLANYLGLAEVIHLVERTRQEKGG